MSKDNYDKAKESYYKGVEGLYREGEEEISKHADFSYFYARDVLKGRFRGGEETIRTYNSFIWDKYIGFLKSRGIEI